MSALARKADPGLDHPMLRALEFLGRPCRVYQRDDARPYLEGVVETLGVTTHGEFFLLVRPTAVQIDDELTPGGCAMIVGSDEDRMRHVFRVLTPDDDRPIYLDNERPVRIVVS